MFETALGTLAAVLLGLILVVILGQVLVNRVIVYETQRALLYTNGKFTRQLAPGSHWIFPYNTRLTFVDVRPKFISIPGQEVLSQDGVTLKVSLAAKYEIADPYIALNKIENFQVASHLILQLALREIIGGEKIDDLLEQRQNIGERLMTLASPQIAELGVKLLTVNVKDIMFPGELKKIFSQVVKARKEGLAALEKARGETAALRNLANAAKLLEANPVLLQLRALQHVGDSSGNTLVLGVPASITPVPVKSKELGESKVDGTIETPGE